jgi:glycosyltransferase involved in cell wall biosynthesis
MNILYIVQHWPSLFESYMFREVHWMKERGHQVAVVSLGSGGPLGFRDESSSYANPSEFGVDDIPVLQLGSSQSSREQIVAESLAFALQQGSGMIDAHFAREPAEIACMVNQASGIPFTIRMRGGDVHSNTSPILPLLVERASAICPVSQFLADVLVGKRSPKRAPDGVPVDVCASKLRILHYNLPASYLSGEPVKQSDEIQVVGSIGRLVPVKRFQDIIEAVAGLAPDFPGLRLLIVGGGVMMRELLELAREAGISERVEITGFKSWDEVMSLASQMHIYVQASELEGFCLAAVEAAFKGMPLILSRTGIHEECAEPGINGYLFDVGDVTAIREGLKSLLLAGAGRRQEMGKASLEIAGHRFCEENVMPKIESIFKATISGDALPS